MVVKKIKIIKMEVLLIHMVHVIKGVYERDTFLTFISEYNKGMTQV